MKATHREDGAVLVEFALVLPVLLFLLFGALHLGLAMHAQINSTHLTAEGARYIAVNQNPGATDPAISPKTMQEFIRSRAATTQLKNASVCISYPTNPATGTFGKVGDPVRVTLGPVTYTPFNIGVLGGRTIPTATVQSSTTMRLEALPTNVAAGCT